jgi:EAL domain-containing protein (putative c-di-GMP-specific phosphodiesterase class I)
VATTDQAGDHEQLLRQADVALASAKAETTTHWRQYESSLHVQVLHQMKLKTELDQAIANGAFTMHYQPIVDLVTAHPRGVEALVRWEHPTLGMIPPVEFIQLAEESGLIIPLGEWILHTAIVAAAGWREAFPLNPPAISVNVSVRQFRAPGFVDRVLAELAASRLPPSLLTIEITESLILGQHEKIHADIGLLRQAGVKVSIDDFGTGYSSLSYLDRVPVDVIKLDKTFVDTIATSTQQLNLVRGIIQLAKMLQLDVVAEGIETDEDRALLVDAGCEFGQGYLFARPMPQRQLTQWLQANRSVTSTPGPARRSGH